MESPLLLRQVGALFPLTAGTNKIVVREPEHFLNVS